MTTQTHQPPHQSAQPTLPAAPFGCHPDTSPLYEFNWIERNRGYVEMCHRRTRGEINPPIESSYQRHLVVFTTSKKLKEILPQRIKQSLLALKNCEIFIGSYLIYCDIRVIERDRDQNTIIEGSIYPKTNTGEYLSGNTIPFRAMVTPEGKATLNFLE